MANVVIDGPPSRVSSRQSFVRALQLFKNAAVRIPAYRDFLKKHRVDPEKIESEADFAFIPPTDKPDYLLAYPLDALSWDGTLAQARFVSSSSGSTGIPLYWPRGETQEAIMGRIFARIYDRIFDTRAKRTLFIDLFALGTWIAGLEFYNAARFIGNRGHTLTITTPGIDQKVALDAVSRLGPAFDRVILAGYPPFLKDLLEAGAASGIRWAEQDVRLLSGGEPFSERWRNKILEMIGTSGSLRHYVNVYGMAENGIIGHETPLTILCRRCAETVPELKRFLLHEGELSPVYQYDPLARYLEVGADHTLILTANAGLPLIRYNTRDQGGLFSASEVLRALSPLLSPQDADAVRAWRLPLVYLFGRRDLSISFYALNIYIENVKHALETAATAACLSGLFTMRVGHTPQMDQRFELTVELARGIHPSEEMGSALATHTADTLRKVNSEYAKLYTSIGERAMPFVRLVRYGEIDTVPGRKHSWVRKS